MKIASRRRRRKQPHHPVHDRRTQDHLKDAQLAPIEVDDPYEEGAKILVMQSTRDDPLAEMRARGQIDECDYEAGRHWQRAWEDAEIGGICGIGTKELTAARKDLGPVGNWIIVSVLGSRKSLINLAKDSAGRDGPVESEYKYLRRRFKRCLSTLAELFGYALDKCSAQKHYTF